MYAPIKGYSPLAITLEEAVLLIEAKIVADADKIIKVFKDTPVSILKGRWGPYIADSTTKKNAKIAKDEDAMTLSFEECVKRLDEAPDAKKRGGKTAAKKAPAKKADAVEKPPVKKTVAKKPAVKKAVAKKPAVKKVAKE